MAVTVAADKNFWLWQSWGKKTMKSPYLVQKVPGRLRDIVVGESFIIALTEKGHLQSWGTDQSGCLGLGIDKPSSNEPSLIKLSESQESIVDVQHGKKHCMALTCSGKIYSWGDNSGGQLGLGDMQSRYEPTLVDALCNMTVVQILAVDNMSYALTSHGKVYTWGDNTGGVLGLGHEELKVQTPEPMICLNDTTVKKLMIKEVGTSGRGGKTVIGFVGMAEPLAPKDMPGGFGQPLAEDSRTLDEKVRNVSAEEEKDIFESVNLMRRVMENTLDWWDHMVQIRHGSPYDEEGEEEREFSAVTDSDQCSAIQLDTHVNLETLDQAAKELTLLVESAKEQLREIKRKEKGTQNVRFVLVMFLGECRLRREKILSTISFRQLKALKRDQMAIQSQATSEVLQSNDIQKIRASSSRLTRLLSSVKKTKTHNIMTKAFQESIVETIECKLCVHETQVELLKAVNQEPADPQLPGYRVIKERWGQLKAQRIYKLYQEFTMQPEEEQRSLNIGNSDEALLEYLVKESNKKIDEVIDIHYDDLVSRDALLPDLCYELLLDNAELLKMCNKYQLKVLIRREKERPKGR